MIPGCVFKFWSRYQKTKKKILECKFILIHPQPALNSHFRTRNPNRATNKILYLLNMKSNSFTATLEIIGINPFVFVPEDILTEIFRAAGKDKSPIPVKGTVNGKEFKQNLMKYLGEWRLYVNLLMLKNSPKRIGEVLEISIEYDDSDRSISIHPKLDAAIKESSVAARNFENLTPSRRHELIRYINNLKTDASIERNIEKIIRHLHGETDFFGKRIE